MIYASLIIEGRNSDWDAFKFEAGQMALTGRVPRAAAILVTHQAS